MTIPTMRAIPPRPPRSAPLSTSAISYPPTCGRFARTRNVGQPRRQEVHHDLVEPATVADHVRVQADERLVQFHRLVQVLVVGLQDLDDTVELFERGTDGGLVVAHESGQLLRQPLSSGEQLGNGLLTAVELTEQQPGVADQPVEFDVAIGEDLGGLAGRSEQLLQFLIAAGDGLRQPADTVQRRADLRRSPLERLRQRHHALRELIGVDVPHRLRGGRERSITSYGEWCGPTGSCHSGSACPSRGGRGPGTSAPGSS